MMIEMVLVYCMVENATLCTEQRPMFEEPLSMMTCMMSAQTTAAAYVAEHPKWTLSRWRCEAGKPQEATL